MHGIYINLKYDKQFFRQHATKFWVNLKIIPLFIGYLRVGLYIFFFSFKNYDKLGMHVFHSNLTL